MASQTNQTLTTDCEVTLSDQKLINRFARLNAKCEELQLDIKNKTRELENIDDAINELILTDDDVYINAGEVFAHLDGECANALCEQKKKRLTDDVQNIRVLMENMKDEMSQIKVTLYAKFGNNINLEYDDEN